MLESSKYVHSFTDVIDWDGMGKLGLTYQYYFSYNQTKLNACGVLYRLLVQRLLKTTGDYWRLLEFGGIWWGLLYLGS